LKNQRTFSSLTPR